MDKLHIGLRAAIWSAALVVGMAMHASARSAPAPGSPPSSQRAMDAASEARILALAPERISAADVRDVLSHAPAPRVICLQGSLAPISMRPFAEFLIAMGYPESQLRDPADGSFSHGSFADGEKLAGTLAWYYESEGMRPMLIGHSQGGMLAIRALYELAGEFNDKITVWNPLTDRSEQRSTIVDPIDGIERPVVGLKLSYVTALATGKLPRILLGQWTMVSRLRAIPDTVEEFTGFIIEWDGIAGTPPGSEAYHAIGSAKVRTVWLPNATSHIAMPQAKELAVNPVTRAWIDHYVPGENAVPPTDAGIDASNILHAADIWFSVKKHWCLEAQKLVRARQAANPNKGTGG
ncbi:MAG: hypothetical protein E6H66_19665 [Betaproteobacteria bacterium]|nr:MAG: hypothetical protein E6H66_19665 [Betaproteobacteria bacterium]